MANFLPDAFREELRAAAGPGAAAPLPATSRRACARSSAAAARPSCSPSSRPSRWRRRRSARCTARACTAARQVAVKVQYPDIEEIVRIDLRALRRIFGVLRWFMPDYGFDTIYREIREMVLAELDYRREAAAIEKIAANFAARRNATNVRFPRVMRRVLDGARAHHRVDGGHQGRADLERLDALKIDRRAAARACVEAYCQQIFIDGLYHADPHPGNLLVAPPAGGRARRPPSCSWTSARSATVSEGMRRGMVSFLQGAMTRDTTRIV